MFQVKLPYKVRCNLCQKPINFAFRQEMEGIMNTFCSPDHARTGKANWEAKLKAGIKPGTPPPPIEEEYISDNLEEITGGE